MAKSIPNERFLKVTNSSALNMQTEAMRMRKVMDEQRKTDKKLKREAKQMALKSAELKSD